MKKILSFLVCAVMAFTTVSGITPIAETIGADTAITAEAAEETSLYKTMLPYFYKQFTKSEKKIYLKIRKAAIDKDKDVTVSSMSKDTFTKLTNCLFYYDTLAFNLSSAYYKVNSDSSITITFKYRFSKDYYDSMLSKMDSTAKKIISKFTDSTSTYAKIKYIHDYLVSHSDYDENSSFSHLAYGAMIKGQAVCDGYAQAFSYICRKAGIMAINVTGEADGDPHMWNKVYYNKKWYNIDVTWDDPVFDFDDNSTYNYFMISDEVMNLTHTAEDLGFDIPAATDDSKNYYDMYKLTASSVNEGKTLLINQMVKASSKGRSRITIKFSDKETLDNFYNYIADSANLTEIFDGANQKADPKILTTACLADKSEDVCTLSVFIFYENSSLSDYIKDTRSVDNMSMYILEQIGIYID